MGTARQCGALSRSFWRSTWSYPLSTGIYIRRTRCVQKFKLSRSLPMTHRTFAMMAGIIFTLVALFHLVRIFADWALIIGDWSVPKWVSWVAYIVAGGLGPSEVPNAQTQSLIERGSKATRLNVSKFSRPVLRLWPKREMPVRQYARWRRRISLRDGAPGDRADAASEGLHTFVRSQRHRRACAR